jgi:hypothetical protein
MDCVLHQIALREWESESNKDAKQDLKFKFFPAIIPPLILVAFSLVSAPVAMLGNPQPRDQFLTRLEWLCFVSQLAQTLCALG